MTITTGDMFEFYFVFEPKSTLDMKVSDWTEYLTPLLYCCGILYVMSMNHEHWWLPPLHLNIQSWLPIELGWQKGVVGLWAVSGSSSSRPRLGMYSDHCHQWRQSRDLLLTKPQSWTMVAARRRGEKIMVLLSQLNIFRSIRYHPHTRVQNGLVIVSSVCNSIIIHTTWRTQGSWLSECLRCILSLSPPCSHLTRTLWRESRCSAVQLLYKYGINVHELEYVTTK